MSRRMIIMISILALTFNMIFAAEELKPEAILNKVDNIMNAPQDQYMKINMTLIDKNGNRSVREIEIYQKGKERRLGKFISPAEYKGIGFLSLPKGVFYIYLPAFGKIKRISSSVKSSKFAGTDFTYEDMEPKSYADNWNGVLLASDSSTYKIKITPKEGCKTSYKYEILTVNRNNYFPVKTEYFKGNDRLIKEMTADSLVNIKGYWIAAVSTMKDIKAKHTSIMKLEDIKLNTGLKNDIFTKRYLRQ